MSVISRQNDQPLSEAVIQDALYRYRSDKSDQIIVPNTSMYSGHEMDLVAVTSSFMVHEYEIKISRSDWLSEMSMKSSSKKRKHKNLADIDKAITECKRYSSALLPPNYYWVVCPEGVIKDELPDYAGCLIVYQSKSGHLDFYQHKKAPRLHTEKMDAKTFISLSRGLMYRYWQKRLKNG